MDLTGPIINVVGSAAAPSIQFFGSPDTGIFSHAPDTLSFAADGVMRAYLNSSGFYAPTMPLAENSQAVATTAWVKAQGYGGGGTATYTLPIASPTGLGGVKVGPGLAINAEGILSSTAGGYTLPAATVSSLGGIIVGNGLAINNGVLSTTGIGGGSTYTLPIASASQLGGFKVGSGLSINSTTGVLDVTTAYTLPQATSQILGGVRIGSGINNNAGLISVTPYSLPMANANSIGGVRVGGGLAIDTNGILSTTYQYTLPAATSTFLGGIRIGTGFDYTGDVLSAIPYQLPPATDISRGGITVGAGLSVTAEGVLSANNAGTGGAYTLPIATATTLGGFKVGNGLSMDAATGILSVAGGSTYVLPIADDTNLGGVKVGNTMTISATGYIDVKPQPSYQLPIASATVLGGFMVGNGLAISAEGILSTTGSGSGYVLPVATSSTLGGVRAGTGVNIDANGILTFSGAAALGNVPYATVNTSTGSESPIQPVSGHTRSIHDHLLFSGINLADYFDPSINTDRSDKINEVLSYAKRLYWKLREQRGGSYTIANAMDVYGPPGNYFIKKPVMVPGGTELDLAGLLIRKAGAGTTADPRGVLSERFIPGLLVSPNGHLGRISMRCNEDLPGSGVCVGFTYESSSISMHTINGTLQRGSGYTQGEIFNLFRDGTTFRAAADDGWPTPIIRVDTVTSNGGINTFTVIRHGRYDDDLRWVSAQGHYDQYSRKNADNSFTDVNVNGRGAMFKVTAYAGYFKGGDFYHGNDTGRVFGASRVQWLNVYFPGDDLARDSVKGYQTGIRFVGLNTEVNQIYCLKGRVGIQFNGGSDARVNNMNTVLSGTAFRIAGYGAFSCSNFAFDSSTFEGMKLNGCQGVILRGRVFWENGNDPQIPHASGYAVQIGDGGDTQNGQMVNGCNIDVTLTNAGNLADNGVACSIGAITGSTINMWATNTGYDGRNTGNVKKILYLYEFLPRTSNTGEILLKDDNHFGGGVNHLSGKIYKGDPRGNNMDIIDGALPGRLIGADLYVCPRWDAPGSTFGAGKCGPGSQVIVRNPAAPFHLYVNEGSISTPNWVGK